MYKKIAFSSPIIGGCASLKKNWDMAAPLKHLFLSALFFLAWCARAEEPHPRWQPKVPNIGEKNLVPNASFECGPVGWSSLGKGTAWGGDLSSLFGGVVSEGAYHGNRCLRIELEQGKTVTTHFDVWPSKSILQDAPLAANVGWLQAEAGQTYTLSAYMRADRAGVPARLVVRFGTNPLPYAHPSTRAQSVVLSTEWARHSFTFTAEEPDVYVALGPDLSAAPGGEAVVWIDAVQLERAPEATAFALRQTIEVGIDTAHLGHNFRAGEPIELRVAAHNATSASTTAIVHATLEDYFGATLPVSSATVSIPPYATQETRLPLNTNGNGFFRAHITWEADGELHDQTLVLSVIEPYPHDESPFGINHAPTTPELAHLLQRAGVRWARNMSMDWNELEPGEGNLSFEKTDQQIDRERAQGFRTLALMPLHPATSWNSTAPAEATSPGWVRLTYMPRDPRQLFEFVRSAVAHYAGRLRFYEFLNEPIWIPNAGGNLSSGAGYKVEDYVLLLKEVYPVIKAADPDAVVLGGLSLQAEMPLGDTFIEQGGLNFCDIYTLHPYPMPNQAPEIQADHLKRIHGVMDTHGGRKPIWATETGYFAEDDLPWQPWAAPEGHHSANNLTSDEKKAADFSIRQAVILLAHGAEKIFYHQGIEGEVNNGSFALDNPLLGPLAAPEKFYPALAALATALGPAPKCAGTSALPEGAHGYAFETGKGSVFIGWRTEEAAVVSVCVPNDVAVHDVMGNVETGSRVELEVSPKYFSSKEFTASVLLQKIRAS